MTKLLLIEDDDNNLTLISRLLEHDGYQVSIARTGNEGIQMALSLQPEIILLDIGLPDIKGTEVLLKLREAKIDASIPIIAVTSSAMSGDREYLLNLGCDGYIEKPIDPLNFTATVKSISDEKQNEQSAG